MNNNEFIRMLEKNKELQKDLFIRGFLLTDNDKLELDEFPFYGNWKCEKHGKYYFMAHNLAGMNIYSDDKDNVYFIFGHAYNPFTMVYDEIEILKRISESYGKSDYYDRISEITGVFVYGAVVDGEVSLFADPSGMQSVCCGNVGDNFYMSSHAQLIGDICDLEMDSFVKELISYKWYGRVMGPYLPCDLTPFTELKRVVPNIEYKYRNGKITHKRFWPVGEAKMVETQDEYDEVIKKAADIMKNTMILIAEKWDRPFISMSGGIDSNTTFAAANGVYDKYETFSFISAEKEVPDEKAAKQIASRFNVKHTTYHIPSDNSEIENFDNILQVLRHNNGYVAELKENEARKRMYLRQHADFDIEVKSWASETIRAYWYKHFGRKSFPKLSGKLYRNLYKIFIKDRSLAHKVDKLFDEYIKDFEYDKISESYPTSDMHHCEVMLGSWGGLNISEMKYCFDMAVPYNNRVFFELLYRVPLEKRISDQHHLDMKKYLNKELYDMGIRVVNLKETDFRAFALNVIFVINTILPF